MNEFPETAPQTFLTDHDLLIKIATTVDAMNHSLFGNGQPGELQRLKDRTATLEEFRWKFVGGLALLGILSGSVGAWMVRLVAGH